MSIRISDDALLKQHIAGLSPAKRALLELKLKDRVREGKSRAAIPRRAHHSPVSLSFAQQRIWFLSQLDPDSPAYNIPIAYRLTGTLDVGVLENALKEIVRRHESLRTRFEDVGGVPQQVIDELAEWPLKVIDLSGKEASEQATEAQRIASEEAHRPFALAREWGLRAQLLRLSE